LQVAEVGATRGFPEVVDLKGDIWVCFESEVSVGVVNRGFPTAFGSISIRLYFCRKKEGYGDANECNGRRRFKS